MYEAIAELIFQSERSDSRFESACLTLVGKHEGITYVPTSQSWDLGRDGRSTSRGRKTHANILCATLNENLDAKVEADMLRLTAVESPDRVVYCSSQKLSEQRVDQIRASIKRHTPNGSVEIYGATQLATLAAADKVTFSRFYGSEVNDVRSMILSEQPSGRPTNGLRLALVTLGSSEGAGLRDEVLRSTLLDRLTETEPQTLGQVIQAFSRDLGLSRVLPEQFLADALESARRSGLVEHAAEGWTLSIRGAELKAAIPIAAAEQLLAGRAIIREALEALTGKRLANQNYGVLWSSLEDALGALFHANGLDVIRAIQEVLSGEFSGEKPLNLTRELEAAMKRVAANIQTTELRAEIYQALLDIFTERDGPAFDWLTRVSERFVTLCALGLERESGDAIKEAIISQPMVPDSDIILDYLCKGEPDHNTSRDLLIGWLGIGGTIVVSPIVLEEVAHNAWISERDFRETHMLLGKLKTYELRRYIRNPFVRTFHYFNAPASKWLSFIGQYRGNSPGDYSKILAILRQRLKVSLLPNAPDEILSKRITDYLRKAPTAFQGDEEHLDDVLYKLDRDGKFLASVAVARAKAQEATFESPMVILSSSSALANAELRFRESLGAEKLVFNKRAFTYLMSTIPGVSLGADTLRRALFTFGSHGRLRSDGTKAIRLIRATGEIDLPWAERFTLRQELNRALKSEANKRGISMKNLTIAFVNGSDISMTAGVIADTVRSLAIPSNVEKELSEANKRISDLEATVAELSRRPLGVIPIPKKLKR